MTAHHAAAHHADLGTTVPHRGIDLPAAVSIAWSLAGGTLFGGAAVVAMLATGRLSGDHMLSASVALFAIGAAAGVLHGATLGILGRPEGMTVGEALNAIVHGLIYLVPGMLLGWLVAGWVAAMPSALEGSHHIAIGLSALAWLAMGGALVFAVVTGLRAAGLAYRRWPHHIEGTGLIAVVLVLQVASFTTDLPTLWFSGTRLTTRGALLLALVSTFWLYGPFITAGLWHVDRLRPDAGGDGSPEPLTWRATLRIAALPVGAGLALALLALPLYVGTVHLPSDIARLGFAAALLTISAEAFTDELVFRLFAMTMAFLVASRLLPGRHAAAVGVAIAFAALLDLAVNAVGIPGLGLPGAVAVVVFATVRIVVPSLVFGYLFWRRGIEAAIGAHVAAGVFLALLAL